MKRVLRSQADYQTTILRNQLTSLILYEAIVITKARAKKLIPFAERFFNRVKKGDFKGKRLAHQLLTDKNAVKKVFEELLSRFQKTTNFTRAYKVANRSGDNAAQILVGLAPSTQPAQPEETKTKVKKTALTRGKKPTTNDEVATIPSS